MIRAPGLFRSSTGRVVAEAHEDWVEHARDALQIEKTGIGEQDDSWSEPLSERQCRSVPGTEICTDRPRCNIRPRNGTLTAPRRSAGASPSANQPASKGEKLRDEKLAGLFCQGCEKCLEPCPEHLPIPELMRSYMYGHACRNREAAQSLLLGLDLPASPCGDCGTCPVVWWRAALPSPGLPEDPQESEVPVRESGPKSRLSPLLAVGPGFADTQDMTKIKIHSSWHLGIPILALAVCSCSNAGIGAGEGGDGGGGSGGLSDAGTMGTGGQSSDVSASTSINCDALASAVQGATSAFVPVSPNSCSADSDCTVVGTAIYRNGQTCAGGCGEVVASAYGTEWSAFLANDPGISAACNTFLVAGCRGQNIPCICAPYDPTLGTCRQPRCISGVCQ